MAFVLSFGVFLFVVVVAYLLSGGTQGVSATEVRLRDLQTQSTAEQRRQARQEESPIREAVMSVGKAVSRGNEKGLSLKLITANYRKASALPLFLGVRTLISVGPALIIVVPRFLSGLPMGKSLQYAMGAWALGHFGSNYWLSQQSQNRIRKITESLPDVLDLMVVCLEAGLGLNAAIQRVGEERGSQGDTLGQELNQVHAEFRAGKDREEALHDLGARNGSEDLRSLTALMIQSQRLGASMGQTLRAHADLLRVKRRQRAEEAARKLPIKMLIPLATLLLVPLFIVVIGPPALKFITTMSTFSNR